MKAVQADPREIVVHVDKNGELHVQPREAALQEVLGWDGLDWALVTWIARASEHAHAVPEVRELLEVGRLKGPRDASQRLGMMLQVFHGLDRPDELWTAELQEQAERPATIGEWRRQPLPQSSP